MRLIDAFRRSILTYSQYQQLLNNGFKPNSIYDSATIISSTIITSIPEIYISKTDSIIIANNRHGTEIIRNESFDYVINYLFENYKNIYINHGNYTSNDDIILPEYGSLIAESGTTITFTDGTKNICLANQYTMIQGFRVNVGAVLITSSHTLCRDIVVSADGAVSSNLGGAFKVHVNPYTTLDDHVFENCTAIDCCRHGFLNEGDHVGSAKVIKNQRYINCQAIRCGATATNDDWYVGFDLNECPTNIMTIQDIQLINCHAEGCLESGFHLEQAPYVYNVQFVNCTSRNNGIIKTANLVYGSGFFVRNGCKLVNCEAESNYQGIFIAEGRGNNLEPIIVRGCVTKHNNANATYAVDDEEHDIWSGWGVTIMGGCNNADVDVSMYQDYGFLVGGPSVKNAKIRVKTYDSMTYGFVSVATHNARSCDIEIVDVNSTYGSYIRGMSDSNIRVYRTADEFFDEEILSGVQVCLASLTRCKANVTVISSGTLVPGGALAMLQNLTKCDVSVDLRSVASTGILMRICDELTDVNISGKFDGGLTAIQANNEWEDPVGVSGSCTIERVTIKNATNGILIPGDGDTSNIAGAIRIDKKSVLFESTVTNPLVDTQYKAAIIGSSIAIIYRNCKAAASTLIHGSVQDLSGTHTDVTNPDQPRCITVTQAGTGTPISGQVTINGKFANGEVGSETVDVPAEVGSWSTNHAFSKVTSVIGYDAGTRMTLGIGVNDIFGLPCSMLRDDAVYKVMKAQSDQVIAEIDVQYNTINLATISNGNDCTIWYSD